MINCLQTHFKGTKVYTYVKFSLKTILCSSGQFSFFAKSAFLYPINVWPCQMVGVVVGVKDDLEESVCDG